MGAGGARGFDAGQIAVALIMLVALSLPAAAATPRRAVFLMESRTGQGLVAQDADTTAYPASLTKMMTLYLAFEAVRQGRLKLDTPLQVSRKAAAQSPSKLGLTAGESVPLRQLILGLTVQSANDAAVVVAEALGGDEARFAEIMTRKARALGMTRTVFKNASGLPNRAQVTTARDMATLGRALLTNFPQEYKYFSVDEFTHDGRVYRTHNRLLGDYDGADGIKTGYIRDSGFNLVASAERDGRRLIGVIFGGKTARTRDREMQALLDRGFATEPSRVLVGAAPRPRPTSGPKVVRAPLVVEVKAKPRGEEPQVALADATEAGSAASAETLAPRDWGVQVGAFDGPVRAGQAVVAAADRVPEILGGAEMQLLQVRVAGKTLFRARFTGLAATEATAACAALAAQNAECALVKPSGAIARDAD